MEVPVSALSVKLETLVVGLAAVDGDSAELCVGQPGSASDLMPLCPIAWCWSLHHAGRQNNSRAPLRHRQPPPRPRRPLDPADPPAQPGPARLGPARPFRSIPRSPAAAASGRAKLRGRTALLPLRAGPGQAISGGGSGGHPTQTQLEGSRFERGRGGEGWVGGEAVPCPLV